MEYLNETPVSPHSHFVAPFSPTDTGNSVILIGQVTETSYLQ